MSEHKYLMSEYLVPRDEWKYRLDVVYQRDIDKQELAALIAELKAAQDENQRLFDLVRQQRMELLQAELITEDEYAKLAFEHSAVNRLEAYDEMRQEIARLRQERVGAANEMLDRVRGSLREYPHGGGDIEVMREVDRIISEDTDRMRTALEDIRNKTGEVRVLWIASDALNQQPAQQEKPKPQTFREGHPVYVCRQCSKQYKEHGQNEECPVGAQSEVKPK